MGARLSSDERAPYEKPEHDEEFDLGEPTNPNLTSIAERTAVRTDESDAP
jgi:hypothetical protein